MIAEGLIARLRLLAEHVCEDLAALGIHQSALQSREFGQVPRVGGRYHLVRFIQTHEEKTRKSKEWHTDEAGNY